MRGRLSATVGALLLLTTWARAETFEGGKLEVYVSRHADLRAGDYVLEREIVNFINEAQATLDIAVQEVRYSGDGDWPIAEAILAAADRGVRIRAIVEGDYYEAGDPGNGAFLDELQQKACAEIIRDENPAIFHDKFVIRDAAGEGAALLTGSTNFTDTGTRANYNHVVIVNFPPLPVSDEPSYYEMLTRYQDEFDEAWGGTFGNHDPAEEPLCCWIGRTYTRVYFSPDNDPDDHLLDLLCDARESLDVMVFTFGSSSPLMAGVVNRWYTWRQQGDPVKRMRVALESQQARYWSALPPLQAMGVPVKLERNPNAKLHHKVAIIDGRIVILGSYNWTRPANEENDENCLVLSNREVADFFTGAFDELWNDVLYAP